MSKGILKPQEIDFEGTLSFNGNALTSKFTMRIDERGDIGLCFPEILMTKDNAFLRSAYADDDVLSICGKSELYEFFSNSVTLKSLHHTSTQEKVVMKPDFEVWNCTVEWRTADTNNASVMKFYLRGLKQFNTLSKKCKFGTIYLGGNHDLKDINVVSGFMCLEVCKDLHYDNGCHTNMKDYLFLLSRIIGFGSGVFLKVPMIISFHDGKARLEFANQTPSGSPFRPPIHFLDFESFFNCAIDALDRDYERIRKISDSLEWFLMDVGYNELRVMVLCVAFESIVAEFLEPTAKKFINDDALEDEIKKVVSKFLTERKHPSLNKKIREKILSKTNLLYKRSMFEIVKHLLVQFNVETSDLKIKSLQNVFEARNDIVHRGRHYERDGREQFELIELIQLLQEIYTRFIFSLLDYRGTYFSWLNGEQTQCSFPVENEQD